MYCLMWGEISVPIYELTSFQTVFININFDNENITLYYFKSPYDVNKCFNVFIFIYFFQMTIIPMETNRSEI